VQKRSVSADAVRRGVFHAVPELAPLDYGAYGQPMVSLSVSPFSASPPFPRCRDFPEMLGCACIFWCYCTLSDIFRTRTRR